ncbi:MAG: hypothetical protein WCH43_05545 [Verrucomicrobiota bacterium]
MSHGHKHTGHKEEEPRQEHQGPHKASNKKWHRDWRVVAAAILMLIAMMIYVLTMDESMWPGRHGSKKNQPAQTVPLALP